MPQRYRGCKMIGNILLHRLRAFWVFAAVRNVALFAVFSFLAPNLVLAQEEPHVSALPIDTTTLQRNLTPWGMFLTADIVVQAVLIGLVFDSIVTWTVWLGKTIELMTLKRHLRAHLNTLAQGRSEGQVERLANARSVVGRFIGAAETELQLSADVTEKDGIKE